MAAHENDLVVGRYRLVDRIGTGGMSTVWSAWDERLHRQVAVKQLRMQDGLSEHDARLAADRTKREARITARLHHPHVVQVYDIVDDGPRPCLVMQYLHSRSLQAVLAERGTLDVREVARIGSQIASALAAAHQAGIVHRDVKPGNILIDDSGSAKITDFGISHALGDVTLTSTGLVTGTPAYLSPEAARGERTGYPADVFSLGATLFTALEGTPPAGTSDNPIALLHQVASGKLNRPSRPTALTPLLDRMLALDPAARPSMAEVEDRLADIANSRGPDVVVAAPTKPIEPAPPSTTMMLPPAQPERANAAPPQAPPPPPSPPPSTKPRRSRRRPLAAAAIVAGLALLGGLVVLLLTLGDSPGTKTGSETQPVTAPSATGPGATPGTNTSTSSSSSASSSASSSSSVSSSASTSSSSRSTTTARQTSANALVTAIDDYYALLPDDTDTAWSLLTPAYQQDHAGGRQGYEDFWGQFSDVTTSDTHATGGSGVETTITYTYSSGSTTTEVTDFTLVDDGTLKIASSDVVG